MEVSSPGPAEILRSAERDNTFIKKLSEDLTQLTQLVLGQRNWLKWRRWTDYYVPASIYYLFTNLSDNQTLGEEYAGILQVDSSLRKIPSKMKMTTMVGLHIFGGPFLDSILTKLEIFLEKKNLSSLNESQINRSSGYSISSPSHSKLAFNTVKLYTWVCTIDWQWALLNLIRIFHNCLPFISQLHLALFFFRTKFYDISKRFTNINYIFLRKYFANTNLASQQNLRYLMWMSLINLFLTATHQAVNFVKSHSQGDIHIQTTTPKEANEKSESSETEDSSRKCSLCLEVRNHPSVTPCGHLFCWRCIIEWLSAKQECPICREHVLPSRVIPLQNF